MKRSPFAVTPINPREVDDWLTGELVKACGGLGFNHIVCSRIAHELRKEGVGSRIARIVEKNAEFLDLEKFRKGHTRYEERQRRHDEELNKG